MKFVPLLLAAALISAPACKFKSADADLKILKAHSLAEPESLDPTYSRGHIEGDLIINLFEGLTQYEPRTLEPLPGGAERWTISPDGKIYTFHLRQTAKWSDGTPVTAHNYVYAWTRLLKPETASAYAFIMYPIRGAKEYNAGTLKEPTQLGVKALNDWTLQVTLREPTPYFLSLVAFYSYYPLPQKIVETHGQDWTRPEHMVSNGAFQLAEWTPHKKIIVKKNPHYWDAANVKIDQIDFHPIDDFATALKKYQAGELDFTRDIPILQLSQLKQGTELISSPWIANEFIRINTKRPVLSDKRVRKALSLAIDRKKLAYDFLKNGDEPITTFVPKAFEGYPTPKSFEYNPEEARRLLAEAGYTAENFPKFTVLYNTKDINKMTFEVIQQMWKENLGIDVELRNEEWKVFLKTMHAQNYDLIRSGWKGDYPDPNTFLDLFLSYSGENNTGWENLRYDQLIQQAAITVDPKQRLQILAEAEALLLEEMPVIPLFQNMKHFMRHPYVKGLEPNGLDTHPLKWVSLEK